MKDCLSARGVLPSGNYDIAIGFAQLDSEGFRSESFFIVAEEMDSRESGEDFGTSARLRILHLWWLADETGTVQGVGQTGGIL
jgi:hypothetical protein